jgi:hypothetical protein
MVLATCFDPFLYHHQAAVQTLIKINAKAYQARAHTHTHTQLPLGDLTIIILLI